MSTDSAATQLASRVWLLILAAIAVLGVGLILLSNGEPVPSETGQPESLPKQVEEDVAESSETETSVDSDAVADTEPEPTLESGAALEVPTIAPARTSSTTPSTASTTTSSTTTSAAAAEPEVANSNSAGDLLEATDLTYEGSFTLPIDGDGTEQSLAYGGTGLAYNPNNNSLFITGHDWHQLTAEVSIPELTATSDPNEMQRATFLQRPEDAADGKLSDISSPPDADYARVGGYLVDGESLIVSAYDYYDASGEQIRSHLLTDVSLGDSSALQALSPDIESRWLGGPMAHIPEHWREAFGGDSYIGGLGGISIASNSSVGPAAATFSIDAFTEGASATLVLGYPLERALDGPEQQSELWNLTSTVTGIVFPKGSSSVLFFGTQGVGEYCYGTGDECGDPLNSSKGTHAYPYRYQVWAYDANELVAVANGQRTAESLRPYAHWELDVPTPALSFQLTGTAYDSQAQRIYVAQEFAEGTNPVIHAFAINTG